MLKKKGVILITTLLFVTMIVMFSIIVAQQGRDTLMSGVGYSESEQAYMAALSGIEYAKAQLALSSDWGKLKDNHPANLDNASCDYFKTGHNIEFKNGGLIAYLNEERTQSFSIVFYSSSGTDAIDDALIKGRMCKYMSYNNLDSKNPVFSNNSSIPADKRPEGSYEITGLRRDIPAKTFYVVSKGISGKHVKYVEAMLAVSGYSGNEDGAAMINGNILINSGLDKGDILKIDHVNPVSDGKLIANGCINISYKNAPVDDKNFDEALKSDNGALITSRELSGANALSSSLKKSKISFKKIEDTDVSSIKESLSDKSISDFSSVTLKYRGSGENVIPQGTYFLYDNEWRYIDSPPIEVAEGKFGFNKAQIDSSIPVFLASDNISEADLSYQKVGNGILFNDRTVKITDSVSTSAWSGQGSAPGLNFAVIEQSENMDADSNPLFYISDDNSVDFQVGDNGSLVSDGNLHIKGELIGSGKIFANGSLSFYGSSSIETAPNSGVVAWAENGMSIEPAKNVSNFAYDRIADSLNINTSIDEEQGKDRVSLNIISNSDGSLDIKCGDDSVGTVSSRQNNNLNEFFSEKSKVIFDAESYSKSNMVVSMMTDKHVRGRETYYSTNGSYSIVDFDRLSSGWEDGSYKLSTYDEYTINFAFDKTTGKDYYVLENKNASMIIPLNNPERYADFVNDYCDKNDFKLDNFGNEKYRLDLGSYKLAIENNTVKIKGKDGYYSSLKEFLDKNTGAFTLYNKKDKTSYSYADGQFTEISENISSDRDKRKHQSELRRALNKLLKSRIKNINDNINIKGSLYNKNGMINVKTDLKKFNILGAIFNANGDLVFDNTSSISMLYDPDYVPIFLHEGVVTYSKFMSVFDY